MDHFQEILKIALTVLVSLGGGAGIIFAFSNWLGKIWADRIMAKERAKYEQGLAELRAKLEKTNEESLSKLRTDLEIYRDTHLKHHNDKLATYGFACGVVSEFLADMNMISLGQRPEGNVLDRFNRGRLKAHGQLAMLAPQFVMDAYDALVDHIFNVLEKRPQNKPEEDWKEIRRLAYVLMNAVRKDIGIDKSEVEYRGKR